MHTNSLILYGNNLLRFTPTMGGAFKKALTQPGTTKFLDIMGYVLFCATKFIEGKPE